MGGALFLCLSQISGAAEEWWDSGTLGSCSGLQRSILYSVFPVLCMQHHLCAVPDSLLESCLYLKLILCSFFVSHSFNSNLDTFTQPEILSSWERVIDSQYIQYSFFARSCLVSSFLLPQHLPALVLPYHKEVQYYFVLFLALCAKQPTFPWASWLPVRLVSSTGLIWHLLPSQSQNPFFCLTYRSKLSPVLLFLCYHTSSWFLPIIVTQHNTFQSPFLPVARFCSVCSIKPIHNRSLSFSSLWFYQSIPILPGCTALICSFLSHYALFPLRHLNQIVSSFLCSQVATETRSPLGNLVKS